MKEKGKREKKNTKGNKYTWEAFPGKQTKTTPFHLN